MLKYSILVLEQDGWMFTWKIRKKTLIGKVARIVASTLPMLLSRNIDSRHFLSTLYIYIYIYIIRYFCGRNFNKIMFYLNRGKNIVKTKLSNV